MRPPGRGPGRFAGAAATVLVLLGLWYLGAYLFKATGDPLATSKLPYPHLIVQRFGDNPGTLADSAWTTLSQALLGFCVGTLAAGVLSVLLAQARWIESAFMPYVFASQMVPLIALVPIARSVFRSDEITRLFIAAFITFFSVTVALVRGLKAAPPSAYDLMDSYNAGRLRTLRYLRLPSALPLFFSGLRIAAPLSLVGSVLVDMMGAQSGLGYLMLAALTFGPAQATLLWSAMLLTLALGFLLSRAVALAERVLTPWQPAFRTAGE